MCLHAQLFEQESTMYLPSALQRLVYGFSLQVKSCYTLTVIIHVLTIVWSCFVAAR